MWAPALLVALFRYSQPRDAWVLRGIGERYGPVLVRRAPRRSRRKSIPYDHDALVDEMTAFAEEFTGSTLPATPRTSGPSSKRAGRTRPRSSRSRRVRASALAVILAAAVTLGAAAAGFAVAQSNSEASHRTKLDASASAGPLRMLFPSAWRRISAPSVPLLQLTDEIAVAASGSGAGTLVVGRTVASNPQLLPPSLLATLPSAPRGSAVKLGGATFYRYLNLSPRGGLRRDAVYSVPTTAGIVLGVCAPRRAPSSFLRSCERSLATLRLSPGTILAPGPIPAYASALNLTIERLNDVRTSVGTRLVRAANAKAQAVAAYKLAAADTGAAVAFQRLNAGTANAANSAVVAALTYESAAYRALGQAASRQDPAGYDRAGALVKRANGAVKAAYSQLKAFGYGG